MFGQSVNWFDVDKEGLAKLLQERGPAAAVLELIQNALDTEAKNITVHLNPADSGYDLSVVDDDPTGFSNLAHAFTLFAESEKKGKVNLRGRFNLGEKLVLAICDSARIASTNGTVFFDADGRHETKDHTKVGSRVDLRIRLSEKDAAEVERLVKTVLIPEGVAVAFNGAVLEERKAIRVVRASLPTVTATADGFLKATVRKSDVRLVEVKTGEKPYLYELGIPVVQVDVPFHVDVQQKVPVGFDRNTISPAYARAIHVSVVNEAPDLLINADTSARGWVADALSDPKITPEAVIAILEAKYGVPVEQLVAFDPSDPQSRTEAQSLGLTVVGGRAFTPEQWVNVRKAGAIPPAGQVAPSRNAALHQRDNTDPAQKDEVIPEDKWTPEQRRVAEYAARQAAFLLDSDIPVTVKIVKSPLGHEATWGQRVLTLNARVLSKPWWTDPVRVDEVVLHETAHHFASDHLDHKFYEACVRLGVRLRNSTLRLVTS